MDQPKTVFLHVGCRKSGTTVLQLGLRRNVAALVDAGLAQPLVGRGSTLRELVEPLRDAVAGKGEQPAREAVAALSARIAAAAEPRHLITLEALAEMPVEITTLVLEGLAEHDVHVVVTARSWALTIPSEWQQRVKARYTGDYVEYAAAVRDPGSATSVAAAEAALFRRRQDVADVVDRWRTGGSATVHVLLVPSDRSVRPDLFGLFAEVVGIDPALLEVPDRVVNPSLTPEDAEVLRRVNLALGDRLPNPRGSYKYSVRKWIAVGAMMRREGGRRRIRLPRDLEGWASAEALRQVDHAREVGCAVHGDEEAFVHPVLPGEDHVPLTDAEVAEAASVVLAELAHKHARRLAKEKRQKRRARRARAKRRRTTRTARGPVTTGPSPASGTGSRPVVQQARRARRVARRSARRVVSRLGRGAS